MTVLGDGLKNASAMAIENERLKSGLYNRVVSGNVEYTACRGCLYPEGGWPGTGKHGGGCWVEQLLEVAPNDLGGELLDLGHEMAQRFERLVVRLHEMAGHLRPVADCPQGTCSLHRDLLDSWYRLTGEELRAGHDWGSRIDRNNEEW